MLSVWGWIRERTKQAVVAGFEDALAEVESGGADGDGEAARGLVQRLSLALPAPEEKAPARRKQ